MGKAKQAARSAVKYDIRMGGLRKDVCEQCGARAADGERLVAHHWSYFPEHRRDVEILCRPCHRLEHARLEAEGLSPNLAFATIYGLDRILTLGG